MNVHISHQIAHYFVNIMKFPVSLCHFTTIQNKAPETLDCWMTLAFLCLIHSVLDNDLPSFPRTTDIPLGVVNQEVPRRFINIINSSSG